MGKGLTAHQETGWAAMKRRQRPKIGGVVIYYGSEHRVLDKKGGMVFIAGDDGSGWVYSDEVEVLDEEGQDEQEVGRD